MANWKGFTGYLYGGVSSLTGEFYEESAGFPMPIQTIYGGIQVGNWIMLLAPKQFPSWPPLSVSGMDKRLSQKAPSLDGRGFGGGWRNSRP